MTPTNEPAGDYHVARAYVVELPALSQERAVTLAEFLGALWRCKGKVVGAMLTCGSICLALSYTIEKEYRASVLMLPAERNSDNAMSSLAGRFGGLASLAGINLGSTGNLKNEGLAILRSRTFIEGFVADGDLLPVIGGSTDRWFLAALVLAPNHGLLSTRLQRRRGRHHVHHYHPANEDTGPA